MICYCGERGTGLIVGQVLAGNIAMLRLAERLWSMTRRGLDLEIVELSLDLNT